MKTTANGVENKTRGFTLIELLVVISIIGILAALVTVSFTSSQRQARDTKRQSDLRFYQNALEVDANKYSGFYITQPARVAASTTLCSALALTNCPEDPKNSTIPATYVYNYLSDGVVAGGHTSITYVLWAKLENSSAYWVICSSGTVFSSATQPNVASCQ